MQYQMTVLSIGEFLKLCTDFDILAMFIQQGIIERNDVKPLCITAFKLVARGAREINFEGFLRAMYQLMSFDIFKGSTIEQADGKGMAGDNL